MTIGTWRSWQDRLACHVGQLGTGSWDELGAAREADHIIIAQMGNRWPIDPPSAAIGRVVWVGGSKGVHQSERINLSGGPAV